MPTNNITRFLDSRQVSYRAYTLPERKLTAEETALALDVPLALVYKSIVVERRAPGKPILAVVPGNREVDLKALARAVGEKKVSAATQSKAEQLTGLQAGGISPLALINRGFEIVFDLSLREHDEVHISGGERGLNLRLPAQELEALCGGSTAAISR